MTDGQVKVLPILCHPEITVGPFETDGGLAILETFHADKNPIYGGQSNKGNLFYPQTLDESQQH